MAPKAPEILDLLQAGVHFGHKTSRWHPKMAPFIFGARSGVHIIDLEKTKAQLEKALIYVKELAQAGKIVLVVGTKKQAAPAVQKYAQEAGLPYVENRWLGGTLTNWHEIYKVIRSYNDLKTKRERGELQKYTKKEQSEFNKEIERKAQLVGGMSSLTKIPDALFVVDLKKEETAIKEANQEEVPIIALCDSNVNPERVQYPIPGNDDAVKAIELVVALVTQTYKEGVEERKNATQKTEEVKPAEVAV